MKKFTIGLYFLGLIVAIVSAAQYSENFGAKDILLRPSFILGLVMAVAGLILWRSQESKESSDTTQSAGVDSPEQSLATIISELRDLISKMNGYNREDWLKHLSRIQEGPMMKFLDGRQQLLNKMSVEKGSELMINFSYGERLLNRAYSCSADGFPEQGLTLAPNALKSFEDCLADISQ